MADLLRRVRSGATNKVFAPNRPAPLTSRDCQPKPAPDIAPEAGNGDTQTLQSKNESLTEENRSLREEISSFFGQLHRERQRLDYVLSEVEGLGPLRSLLMSARDSQAFQAAFEDPNPLVSVLVATCDRPKLLVERCLESIRNQTYKNLQIIVAGDHSVDETQAMVAALGDDRIEFHNLPRRGPYPRPGQDRWHVAGTAPLLAAQALAKGQFITYLDDDDSWEPRRIEIMVNVAKEQRAEFIWHQFWFLWPDGSWKLWGNGRLEYGQVGVQMVFYHRFFLQVPWDVTSYRIPEPNDWNHLRKIWHLRPRSVFVEQPLTWYFKNYESPPFAAQEGESFLD